MLKRKRILVRYCAIAMLAVFVFPLAITTTYAADTTRVTALQSEQERLEGMGGTSTPLTQELLDANYIYIPGDGWVDPRCQEVLNKIMLRQIDTMNRVAQRETGGLLTIGFNYYTDYAARRMAQDRVHPHLRTPVSEAMFTYGFRVSTGSNVSYRQFFLDKVSLRAERPLNLIAGEGAGGIYRIQPYSYMRWMYQNASSFPRHFAEAIANAVVSQTQRHHYFARGLNYYNGHFSHANLYVSLGQSREERLAAQEGHLADRLELIHQELRSLGVPENLLPTRDGITVTTTTTIMRSISPTLVLLFLLTRSLGIPIITES